MKNKMTKRMIIMLACISILFGAIYGYHMFGNMMMMKFMSGNSLPPATVTATTVTHTSWQPKQSTVGTLRAVEGVDISSEADGIISKIHFQSGDLVKKGDLLLELNAREEIAQLDALKASRQLAEINQKRNREQLAIRAISQSQLDATEAELNQINAQVQSQLAAIDKKRIKAPFSGRLGVTTINPGQYLNPADKIVTLQNNSSLYIDFKLPQKLIGNVKNGQRIHIKSDTGIERDGHIRALNTTVDPVTRNIAIEGLVENKDKALLPGMFVNIVVDMGEPQQLLTLPQTAVSYNPYGSTMFIAKNEAGADGKPRLLAQQVFVTTGDRRGDQIAILDGIKDGDMVVTSGQMKLTNGTPLIIDNSVTPANDSSPQPQEQ